MPKPRTGEGRPLWGRAVYTALHGARLSSVPSGDQSANPASVPGRSGLQRAFLSVSSAQKYSGAGRLATPSGVSRAARSAVPCRSPFQGTVLAALSTPEASLERLVPLVGHPAAWEPLPSVSHGICLSRLWFLVCLRDDVGLRTVISNRRLLRQSWCQGPGLVRASPLGKSGVHRITRCPSLLSALRRSVCQPCQCPGRSGLQRAFLSVSSAQKCSGAGKLATPSGVSRAARSAVPCRSSVPGHRASRSKYTGLRTVVPLGDF